MVKKSLHHPEDFSEVIERIKRLTADAERKWGKMEAGQMLKHCSRVLQVPLGKTVLPPVNIILQAIGAFTKKEMQAFNNGIPRNMPTFRKLMINFDCDFVAEKQNLLDILEEYRNCWQNGKLPDRHALFGRMKEEDWGFMEYKHLHHHLKQFNV